MKPGTEGPLSNAIQRCAELEMHEQSGGGSAGCYPIFSCQTIANGHMNHATVRRCHACIVFCSSHSRGKAAENAKPKRSRFQGQSTPAPR